MIDQQEQHVSVSRDKGMITGALITIAFGLGYAILSGYIVFGIITILCGIVTLAISRFGAKSWGDFVWYEWILAGPGAVLGYLFIGVSLLAMWLLKVILDIASGK